jgi:hypothetical protein
MSKETYARRILAILVAIRLANAKGIILEMCWRDCSVTSVCDDDNFSR